MKELTHIELDRCMNVLLFGNPTVDNIEYLNEYTTLDEYELVRYSVLFMNRGLEYPIKLKYHDIMAIYRYVLDTAYNHLDSSSCDMIEMPWPIVDDVDTDSIVLEYWIDLKVRASKLLDNV